MRKVLTHKRSIRLLSAVLVAMLLLMHPVNAEQAMASQGARIVIQEEKVLIDGDDIVIIVDENVPLVETPQKQEPNYFIGALVIGIFAVTGSLLLYIKKRKKEKNNT